LIINFEVFIIDQSYGLCTYKVNLDFTQQQLKEAF